MELLDVILLLLPLPVLLLLHEPPPHIEAGLVRNRRQGILEPNFLPVLLDHVQHVDGGRQPVAVGQVLQEQDLRFLAFPVDLLRRVRISLRLAVPEVSLHLHCLYFLLRYLECTSMTYSWTEGWNYCCEIYCTGGAKCRGT